MGASVLVKERYVFAREAHTHFHTNDPTIVPTAWSYFNSFDSRLSFNVRPSVWQTGQ